MTGTKQVNNINFIIMRTNSKEVKNRIKKHILECVYDNNEQEFKTIGEAVKHLTNDFKRVADYQNNLKRIPNNCERFTDYLQNIPFNFEYENYKLESFLNGLEINPNNKEYSSGKMWNLYGLLIFREIEKEYNK